MEVREAVEGDAEGLAAIADAPTDAMVNLIHDRSVRVAIDHTVPGPNVDARAEHGEETLLGYVSFDAGPDAVHVTQLDGTVDACEQLLEEPLSFARRERMGVELLVPEDETDAREAAEAVGFDRLGSGPRFEGRETVRYRFEP
ncbi:MAG: hypothetical protein V5A33_00200 [Halobacteriales archaeon]